jgi:serine/threonine-protein kinase
VSDVFGPYRVCEPLGIGGMATVHRAEIVVGGTLFEVALKCLDEELAQDRTFVRRFVAEARLGQLLKHPNIARTHEVGCIDNIHFIAFEWVPGVTLMQVFELARETQPTPVQVTLRVITQVARALAYAHELCDEQRQRVGLIHRDIAPSNIIVGDNGTTKLIDFGVAKSSLAHVNTVPGSVIGKLGYVAPEYLRTGKCDLRADVYSLGVIAWEMLTGQRLFEAEALDAAEAERAAPLTPPSRLNHHVPASLDRIILAALARDPAKRWQTAGDLADVLDRFTAAKHLAIEDADVSAWVMSEFGEPARRPVRAKTSEVVSDVDHGVEQAFARVRLRTEPGSG